MATDPNAWRVVRLDDGVLMVCTVGDTICFSDPNHVSDPDKNGVDEADNKHFALIAAAPDFLKAAEAMKADHMTSEKHHPGYVLVPTAAFELMCGALAKAETP